MNSKTLKNILFRIKLTQSNFTHQGINTDCTRSESKYDTECVGEMIQAET